MAKATNAQIAEHFSKLAGREDQYDVRNVESVNGTKQVQVIDKDTGSISAVFEGAVDLEKLIGSVTSTPAVTPKEASEDDETFSTSRGVPASPTQPEAILPVAEIEEIDNSDKSGLKENQTAEVTENQRVTASE